MDAPAVEVVGLVRTYRTGKGWRPKGPEVTALAGLDLTVPQGEVHGLLGPNGAGKTTLCRVLSTSLLPSSGSAKVLGHDVVRETGVVRPLVGIVYGGERGLYYRLTARQNLRYWAALYKLSDAAASRRAQALLDRVGLADKADTPVETFSRGMKQRLHLARGLIGEPKVVLLDEPTTGMDPVAAHDFRALVGELRAEGRTVLLTTHDMAEAEEVCDRVTLIDGGRVIATETPRGLARRATRALRVEADDVPVEVVDRVRRREGVLDVVVRDGVMSARVDGEDASAAVLELLVESGVRSLRTLKPRLEDVYIELVGARGMDVR
ncbi:ABC transporter ATP-binding protein [Cellulomonas sp. KRMCY2]|uniref:ABC transporter ATP-binding protein n=1 Tax=Cellulomonas sp. KRMCY2 TaxID=1304865 RepID=UPI0005589951|nr:ABC transporter ATP-binding protein [Cellulomonas sp. KRMCY2]